MAKFWDLLQESVIVQGVLTLAVVGVWLYLVATGQTPPDYLTSVVSLVIGFYFGSKLALRKASFKEH